MNRGEVLELIHNETGSRFEQILEELRRERETQNRKWDAQNRKWEENQEAQDRKWEANQAIINQMLQSIRDLARKHDSTIGALGARWGLYSEQSFRNALKGILERSFGVEVINVNEYDDAGEVFGRPDQVELDLIIKNGELIICEIKSSMSKSDMYAFYRKINFYEKRHGRQATRKIVISPMIDPRAQKVAQELGIEIFSAAEDVTPERRMTAPAALA